MLRKASRVLGLFVLLLALAVAGGRVVVAAVPATAVEYQYDPMDGLVMQVPAVQNGIARLVLQADSTHTVVYKRELATTWPWVTEDTSTEFVGSYTVKAPQQIVDPNETNLLCCCSSSGSSWGHYSSVFHDCFGGGGDCEMITMICTCGQNHCAAGTTKLVLEGPNYPEN